MKKFNEYINESIRDKMEPKTKEDIRKIFKDKYDIDYLEFEEILSELKKEGVDCKLVGNPYEPIEIKEWSITRVTGSQGWGIGTAITEKLAQKIANVLSENLGEFWKENGDIFEVKKDSLHTSRVNHEEALIILSKLRKM